MFNIAKQLGWETFWNSVKFTWDSTFVDALGPRDPIEIKPKSNTDYTLISTKETLFSMKYNVYCLRKYMNTCILHIKFFDQNVTPYLCLAILKHSFLRNYLANGTEFSYKDSLPQVSQNYAKCFGHMTKMADMPI